MCLQPSNQLNQRGLVKFEKGEGGQVLVGQKSCAFTRVHRLNICPLVLTHTVMAIGLDLPEGRTEGGYQARTDFFSADYIYLMSPDPNLTSYLHKLYITLSPQS